MLQVNNLSFKYNESAVVLNAISFSVKPGEHVCIMGESGCGKSTLLKVIYGLFDTNNGAIFWDDYEVLGPAHHLVPGVPFFKYVAQDFDLMPYISVSENIKKFLSRFYPEEAQQRTDELLKVIEMESFANEKVKNLSGGQQQRVAIARALAKEPELLLLDEPFSQIDNFKKNSLRRNLFAYLKEKKIACIIATHDGNDALSFADKMLVIQNNSILKSGSPSELYSKPTFKYIATLFDDVNEVVINNQLEFLYPHQIKIVPISDLKATVVNAYFKGYYWLIEVIYKDIHLFVSHEVKLEKESSIGLQFLINT